MNLIWGISQLQAYTGLATFKRDNLFEAVLTFLSGSKNHSKAKTILDIAHVGYVIVPKKQDLPFKGMKFLKQVNSENVNKTLTLFSNPQVLQRARVVTQYKTVKSINDLVSSLLSMKNDDLRSTVVLENTVDIKSSKLKINPYVDWIEDKNQYIKLKLSMPADGILVLADMYEKNWKAYDNGKEVKILPANLIQRALILKKGEHMVEFKYEPASFYKGIGISVITHIIVLGGFVLFSFRNRKTFFSKL